MARARKETALLGQLRCHVTEHCAASNSTNCNTTDTLRLTIEIRFSERATSVGVELLHACFKGLLGQGPWSGTKVPACRT